MNALFSPCSYRHLLHAPCKAKFYGGATFPGLVDLLSQKDDDEEHVTTKWEDVKKHLSTIIIALNSAADLLTTGQDSYQI